MTCFVIYYNLGVIVKKRIISLVIMLTIASLVFAGSHFESLMGMQWGVDKSYFKQNFRHKNILIDLPSFDGFRLKNFKLGPVMVDNIFFVFENKKLHSASFFYKPIYHKKMLNILKEKYGEPTLFREEFRMYQWHDEMSGRMIVMYVTSSELAMVIFRSLELNMIKSASDQL